MLRSDSPIRAASALRTPATFRLDGDVWTIAFGAELDEPWTIGACRRARREPLNPRTLEPFLPGPPNSRREAHFHASFAKEGRGCLKSRIVGRSGAASLRPSAFWSFA